jgi:hypothetical protein
VTTEWLAIQSFQYSQNLLSAINTLSIHTKLYLAGIPDEERAEAADRARETLASFLEELEPMVQEEEKGNVVLGIDPRRHQLVKSFIFARNRNRFHSILFQGKSSRVQELLRSDERKDLRSLLPCLEELRVLLEEHIRADAMQILGGL